MPINLDRLLEEFKEFTNMIESQTVATENSNVSMLVGNSGAGKSTLINYLLGEKFVLKGRRTKLLHLIKDGREIPCNTPEAERLLNAKIGTTGLSQTRYPSAHLVNSMSDTTCNLIYDTPGLEDNGGSEARVIASIGMDHAMHTSNKLKSIALCIPLPAFTNENDCDPRAKITLDMLETLKGLATSAKDLEELDIRFVFTKLKDDDFNNIGDVIQDICGNSPELIASEKVENYKQRIINILESNENSDMDALIKQINKNSNYFKTLFTGASKDNLSDKIKEILKNEDSPKPLVDSINSFLERSRVREIKRAMISKINFNNILFPNICDNGESRKIILSSLFLGSNINQEKYSFSRDLHEVNEAKSEINQRCIYSRDQILAYESALNELRTAKKTLADNEKEIADKEKVLESLNGFDNAKAIVDTKSSISSKNTQISDAEDEIRKLKKQIRAIENAIKDAESDEVVEVGPFDFSYTCEAGGANVYSRRNFPDLWNRTYWVSFSDSKDLGYEVEDFEPKYHDGSRVYSFTSTENKIRGQYNFTYIGNDSENCIFEVKARARKKFITEQKNIATQKKADLETKLNDLETEELNLAKYNRELQVLRDQLAELTSSSFNSKSMVDSLTAQIALLKASQPEMKEEIAEKQAKVTDLEAVLQSLYLSYLYELLTMFRHVLPTSCDSFEVNEFFAAYARVESVITKLDQRNQHARPATATAASPVKPPKADEVPLDVKDISMETGTSNATESDMELSLKEIIAQLIAMNISREAAESSLHAQAVRDNAAAQGFMVEPVDRDGNCFYSAVIKQLESLSYPLTEILNGEEVLTETALEMINIVNDPTVENLRQIIANYIHKHQDEYKNFVEGDYTKYHEKLTQTGVWADELVLRAFANLLKLTIVLIRSDSNEPQVFQPHTGKSNGEIYLGYEVGQHYVSLQRNAKKNDLQSDEKTEKRLIHKFCRKLEAEAASRTSTADTATNPDNTDLSPLLEQVADAIPDAAVDTSEAAIAKASTGLMAQIQSADPKKLLKKVALSKHKEKLDQTNVIISKFKRSSSDQRSLAQALGDSFSSFMNRISLQRSAVHGEDEESDHEFDDEFVHIGSNSPR